MKKLKDSLLAGITFCLLFGVFTLALYVVGCTQNHRVTGLGATMTINLSAGRKLVTANWCGQSGLDLWYLTRPIHPGETAERLEFKEESNRGVAKGTVIFQEH